MQKVKYTISDFYCVYCGNKGISIPRPKGKQRESGHLKKLYCHHCGGVTNHAEIRPFGSYTYYHFKEEFESGRFVNGKRVEVKDLKGCGNLECPYNHDGDGKCWNAQRENCKNRIIGGKKNGNLV